MLDSHPTYQPVSASSCLAKPCSFNRLLISSAPHKWWYTFPSRVFPTVANSTKLRLADTYNRTWNRLTLLAAQLRRIHRLAKNLHGQPTSLFQIAILLIILFQQALCTCIVRSHARCLPTSIVSAWITVVELKLTLVVVAGIDERYSERSKTTMLGIALLKIT